MNEFKGTKGPWEIEHFPRELIVTGKDGEFVNNIRLVHKPIISKANAQLISKAPEMLDALEEIVSAFDHGDLKSVEFARQLIKEATTI